MRPARDYANHSRRARGIACALDTILSPLIGPAGQDVRRSAAGPAPERILLIRPDHAGDLLMATPAIRALRAAHPSAKIDLLASPWGAPAVENNPDLDRLRIIDA